MIIVLATENAHKFAEMRDILTSLAPEHEYLSLRDLPQPIALPEEIGETFVENAEQKARFVAKATELASIGDDFRALCRGAGWQTRRQVTQVGRQ